MKRFMKHPYLTMVLLVGGMFACGKKVPSDVIQPKAMENLLYDYHLATTLGNNLTGSETQKRKSYYDYVFQKHRVTEAEFDSSMVWYSRHTEELSLIYENLQKRYETAEQVARMQVDRQSGQISVSQSGDTVDIWRDRSIYWLTNSPLTNKVVFNLKADTTFRPKDVLVLEADFNFMPVKNRGKVSMGLNLAYKNDSVQGLTRQVSSGRQTLFFRPDSAYEFKVITGFIYYEPIIPEQKGHVLVNDIHLYRYHTPETAGSLPVSAPDSLKKVPDPADTAKVDTTSRLPRRMKDIRPVSALGKELQPVTQ